MLIWHLRGHAKATAFFKRLAKNTEYELWTGALQRAEIVFFMRPHEEKDTLCFLAEFQTAVVDQTIVDTAAGFYRKWKPSHGVDINDMLLAATVIYSGGHIFTLNKKHYPMKDVVVKKAW